MGAVYLGEHVMLGRPAAIKILLPALSQNREMVGRFFNEARATTAIRHPGIVEIYDFGFLPDGAAYIAMEMLDGESLAARLRRVNRLSVAAAVDIGRQVAAALQAAHSRGITHRDLKPDNMFLIRDPEIGERVKLLDFGIAKLVSEEGGNRTRTGVVMGTPVYMSPEQCRGIAALDSRADLYSLGCVLYELLAGRPPFVAESAGDIIAHHLYFQPEPVRRHDPSVPEGLEGLIMALLAKDPAMRPASAADVTAMLDAWRTAGGASSSVAMHAAPTMHAAAAMPASNTGRPGERIVSSAPTTLSGSAGTVATRPGISQTGQLGSNKRRLGLAALGTVVVAASAIVIVLVARRPEPSATVAASAPPATSAPTEPAVPSPSAAAPSAAAPPAVTPPAAAPSPPAVAPSPPSVAPSPPAAAPSPPPETAAAAATGKPTESRKSARVTAPPKPSAASATKKPRDAAAAPSAAEEPKAVASVYAPPPAPAAPPPAYPPPAASPEPKPAPAAAAPPPAAEVARKTEPKPAETTAPAKPSTSKWGHLTGDKNVDVDDFGLLKQCKAAAAKGDCAEARAIAARIATKNVAMYRARVVTDPAVSACLNAK